MEDFLIQDASLTVYREQFQTPYRTEVLWESTREILLDQDRKIEGVKSCLSVRIDTSRQESCFDQDFRTDASTKGVQESPGR